MTSVVINLQARKAKRVAAQLEKACLDYGLDERHIYLVEDATDIRQLFKRLVGEERVIIGGGDGTVLAAINAFAKTSTKLGVLPLGTANNLAQVLGLESDPILALRHLLRSKKHRQINLGRANDTYFSSMATVGISAVLNKEIDNKLKSRLGTSAYAIEGVKQLANHKSFKADVIIDGQPESFQTHEIIVANTTLNLPFNLNIDFELDRDELMIVSLSKTASRIKQLQGLYKLINNTNDADMLIETGQKIQIDAQPTRPYECDGEHIGDTPLEITLEKNALDVIV